MLGVKWVQAYRGEMNDTGIQAVERWEKNRERETSLNMMKRWKGEEQASQRKKEGHVIFCLFSLGKKKISKTLWKERGGSFEK